MIVTATWQTQLLPQLQAYYLPGNEGHFVLTSK